MPTLALVPPIATETRPADPPAPSNVTPLPTPDADAAATARYLTRKGWTAADVLAAGMGLDVWAAMLAREIADEAGPSCPA
jgi:hypothetical protein